MYKAKGLSRHLSTGLFRNHETETSSAIPRAEAGRTMKMKRTAAAGGVAIFYLIFIYVARQQRYPIFP